MMSNEEPAAPPPPVADSAAAVVRLCDFYADDPESWFCTIDSIFVTARVTRPVTKFHWAISKLQSHIMPSIAHLCREVNTLEDPYGDLRRLIVKAYGLSPLQRTEKLLDYPNLGTMKPSVLWDQLRALMPSTLEEIQLALFYRRLPAYIRDAVGTRKFTDQDELTELCNQVWEHHGGAAAAAAAAAAVSHRSASPARDRRAQSPNRSGRYGQQGGRPQRRRSPTPGAPRSWPDSAGRCYYHSCYGANARKCKEPCTYQEN